MNGPGSEGAAPEAPTREGRAAGGLQLGGFTKYIALAALIGVLGGLAAAAYTVLVDTAATRGFGRVAGTMEGGVLRTANPLLVLALPALAAGNAVVVKPSEVTPLCGAASVGALIDGLKAYAGIVGLLHRNSQIIKLS